MRPHPEHISGDEAQVSAATLPLNPSRISTRTLKPECYSEQFAAVLAENGRLGIPAKGRTALAPRRRGLALDDSRHLPDLMAAALACLLLVGSGAASWYAIIGALPRGGATPLPTALVASGAPVSGDPHPTISGSPAPEEWTFSEVWLPAALDPALTEPVPIGIETAGAPVAALPKAAAHTTAPVLVAITAETTAAPDDPTAQPVTGAPPEPSAGMPATTISGDPKGTPNSEPPSITTASSRVEPSGAAGKNDGSPAGNGSTAGGTGAPSTGSDGEQTGDQAKSTGSDTSAGKTSNDPAQSGSDQTGDQAKGSGGDTPSSGPAGKPHKDATSKHGAQASGTTGKQHSKDAKSNHGGKASGTAGPKDNKAKGHADKDKAKGDSKGHGGKGNDNGAG